MTTYNETYAGQGIRLNNESIPLNSTNYHLDGSIVFMDIESGSATLYETSAGIGLFCNDETLYCNNENYYCDGSVVFNQVGE